ncbi:MAG TPA: ABC transporter substrate-binding protein, partial [Candidatus Binatia bacterium]
PFPRIQNQKFVQVAGLVLAFLTCAAPAEAQQRSTIPKIGYVSATGDSSNQGVYVEALRRGLKELGYVEGKNITVEYRGARGETGRIPRLVRELVQLKVDVLVAPVLPAIRAAKEATRTIPLIMVISEDPVAAGLVDSLARPGGNITGLTRLQRELSGKRLELLKQTIPRLARIAVLRDAESPSAVIAFKEYENAAHVLKLQLQSVGVLGSKPDLDGAFQNAAAQRVNALITVTNANILRDQERVAELALRHRLPSMFEGSTWVDAGGLISYSTNDLEIYRRAATYVDKILKGAKPSELPVEQPNKFELVINLRTAKQIGLTIPSNVLARADRVVR